MSLATSSQALFGPWTRRNTAPGGAPANAPCVDLNGAYVRRRRVCVWGEGVRARLRWAQRGERRYSENPIVSRRPDDSTKFQVRGTGDHPFVIRAREPRLCTTL